MTQTGEKASPESRTNPRVAIRTDGSIEQINDVADIAEVAPGRLMVATSDGDREMIDGMILGASGIWKMWHDQAGAVVQYVAESPWTTPPDVTTFRYRHDDHWLRMSRGGRIKRLKDNDL
jgi:hypothetical protein